MSEIATVSSSVSSNLSYSTDKLNQEFVGIKEHGNINGNYNFVGMGDPATLNQYIQDLIIKLENDFIEYSDKSDITEGLKGEAAVIAENYVTKIGTLIKSFVSYYKTFITLSTKAYEQMKQDDIANSNTISDEVSRVNSAASLILEGISDYTGEAVDTSSTVTINDEQVPMSSGAQVETGTNGFTNFLYRTGATALNAVTSFGLGALNFVEGVVDCGGVAMTCVSTVATGIYDGVNYAFDKITGQDYDGSLTKKIWDNTMAVVKTDYVSSLSDVIYDNTDYGDYLHDSYFYDRVKSGAFMAGETAAATVTSMGIVKSLGLSTKVAANTGAEIGKKVVMEKSPAMMKASLTVGTAKRMGAGAETAFNTGAGVTDGLTYSMVSGITGATESLLFGQLKGNDLVSKAVNKVTKSFIDKEISAAISGVMLK